MENYNRIETYYSGNKYYCLNDKLHRIDGPAIEYANGTKFWYQNDKLHRVDGPAKEWFNGTKEWWFEGKYIDCNSQKEFEKLIKMKLFW